MALCLMFTSVEAVFFLEYYGKLKLFFFNDEFNAFNEETCVEFIYKPV
jgi:hypothetical protein